MEQAFAERAKENIAAADLLDAERYNASANRAYYAVFHAAIAALFYYGYTPDIDHKPVQASFVRLLVHQRKIFPASIKTDLLELQNVRSEADYRAGIGKNVPQRNSNKHRFLFQPPSIPYSHDSLYY